MADITDVSPFAVGEKVQYYLSYLNEPPKWYSGAVVCQINPPSSSSPNETFDISSTFLIKDIRDNVVRPYRGRDLKVGQICEYVIATDEEGYVTATIPYTIVGIQDDGALVLNFTQRGMHVDHLHKMPPEVNDLITLITATNPISMMVLICISMIVCTDNVISHDETGDGPKSVFAMITPSGCNPLVGKRLYGNDSSMMWSDQGWQFFQRVGMCPVGGLDQIQSSVNGVKMTTINYRGCMDFRFPERWQNVDNMNALAGVTTRLATAANAQLTTFQSLNIACCTMIWCASCFWWVGSPEIFNLSKCYRFLFASFWVSFMSVAFACAFLSFRLVNNSDLLQPSSFQNSLFLSCQVSIAPFKATTTVSSSYTTHLTLVCYLGVLLFLGVITLVYFLCMREEKADMFKSPPADPTTRHPHIVVTEDYMMSLAITSLPATTNNAPRGTGEEIGAGDEGVELRDVESHHHVAKDNDAMLPSRP